MKYIFVTGAPGSKWSSVVRNIYYSPDIDRSDSSPKRTYRDELHLGAYWDPGMEFGQFFHRLSEYDHYQCETEFDAPFTGSGVRIIKSHYFAQHIDYIKSTWPDSPIVLAHRTDDACLGWWVKCGGFDIAYPEYAHYKSFENLALKIQQQNAGIVAAALRYPGHTPLNNHQLCEILKISPPPPEYHQNYGQSDVRVTVI
jgi:hypothetical protein